MSEQNSHNCLKSSRAHKLFHHVEFSERMAIIDLYKRKKGTPCRNHQRDTNTKVSIRSVGRTYNFSKQQKQGSHIFFFFFHFMLFDILLVKTNCFMKRVKKIEFPMQTQTKVISNVCRLKSVIPGERMKYQITFAFFHFSQHSNGYCPRKNNENEIKNLLGRYASIRPPLYLNQLRSLISPRCVAQCKQSLFRLNVRRRQHSRRTGRV